MKKNYIYEREKWTLRKGGRGEKQWELVVVSERALSVYENTHLKLYVKRVFMLDLKHIRAKIWSITFLVRALKLI